MMEQLSVFHRFDDVVVCIENGHFKGNAAVQAVQHEIEGLAIEWLKLDPASPSSGSTIGDGEFRTRTGVSIVAVIRNDAPFPAPEPTFHLESGDVLVCVGTADGLDRVRQLIAPG